MGFTQGKRGDPNSPLTPKPFYDPKTGESMSIPYRGYRLLGGEEDWPSESRFSQNPTFGQEPTFDRPEYGTPWDEYEPDPGWSYGFNSPSESYQSVPAFQPNPDAPDYTPQFTPPSPFQRGGGTDVIDSTMDLPWSNTPYKQPGGLGSRPFFIPKSQGTTTTSNIIPANIPVPQMGNLPEFKIPERDEARIRNLTQLAAAPGMRGLRNQIREAQGRHYENPNVKRMTLRDALAGYGLGLESVMSGARRQAAQEYEAEYGPKMTKAQVEYQAELNRMMTQYQAAWKDYQNRIAQQTIRT